LGLNNASYGLWKLGKQQRRANPWSTTSRISKEEAIMHDWFISHGWISQFHINTTNLGWKGLRVPSTLIRSRLKRHPYDDIEGVKKTVLEFVKNSHTG
jgi:hypothetical protein